MHFIYIKVLFSNRKINEGYLYDLLSYLILKNPSVRFIIEAKKGKCIAFLDIEIFHVKDKFETTMHHKLDVSGVHTNCSFFPMAQNE